MWDLVQHTFCALLADVHSACFAPAITLSQNEGLALPQMEHPVKRGKPNAINSERVCSGIWFVLFQNV
jgi:hypothetical protein